ncbi:MAG: hypothetical protein V3V08_05915 [Nannocystaceae bacterium]
MPGSARSQVRLGHEDTASDIVFMVEAHADECKRDEIGPCCLRECMAAQPPAGESSLTPGTGAQHALGLEPEGGAEEILVAQAVLLTKIWVQVVGDLHAPGPVIRVADRAQVVAIARRRFHRPAAPPDGRCGVAKRDHEGVQALAGPPAHAARVRVGFLLGDRSRTLVGSSRFEDRHANQRCQRCRAPERRNYGSKYPHQKSQAAS